MTTPAPASGFLDFFILEASEYVEQLDGLMARAGATGGGAPDAEAVARNARALRGSATMAKLTPFAELATALERVARGLRDGAVTWSPALAGTLVATIDDLKILIRSVRSWSVGDDQRAANRAAELARIAPVATPSASTASAAAGGAGGNFFAAESSNIAAGLELLATRPNDRDAAVNVLRRVRAMRGVAGIKDVVPLSEVMAGAELVAKPLELGQGPLDSDRIAFLRAAATLLRHAAGALRDGRPADAPSPERDAFVDALSRFESKEQDASRIVPITELFYTDAGPHVVSASPHPPTTPAERFRLEVVSQGEHLNGLVAQARRERDASSMERVRRDMRHALAAMRSDAESFGEEEVAELIGAHFDAVKSLDYLSLNALEALAQALASPGLQGERLASQLAELKLARQVDAGIGEGFAALPASTKAPSVAPATAPIPANAPSPAPARAAPAPSFSSTAPTPVITPRIRADASMATAAASPNAALQPKSSVNSSVNSSPSPAGSPPPPRSVPSGPRSRTPIGAQRVSTPRDTMAVLDQGIDSLSSIASHPMSEPVDITEQPLVPIDALLYRGRAAIQRAIELREAIRRGGGNANDETMAELFDLLDLALAE